MTENTIENKEMTETTDVSEIAERSQLRRRYIPRTDIYETDDAVYIALDMPGISQDQVDLTLEKDILTIAGSIQDNPLADHELKYREYRIGDYRRTFRLSDEVNQDAIEASMKNGVLRLTLPKAEEVKARKIEVRTA